MGLQNSVTDLIRKGRYDAALSLLDTHLKDTIDDELALSMAGSVLMMAGRFDEGLARFEAATRAHPRSAPAFGDLGFAYMKLKHVEKAIAAFEGAVKLNPRFFQAWVALARLHYEQGVLDKAKSAFQNAMAHDPFKDDFERLRSAMGARHFADAEQIARTILSRQAGHPKAAYALSHLASNVGAHEESVKILKHGLEHFPADANLWHSLIHMYEELGYYTEAVDAAEAFAALDGENVQTWLLVGRVYGHCGLYDKSLEAYDRALTFSVDKSADQGHVQLLRGHMLKILGRRDACEAAYRASIAATAMNGAGWWGLADLKNYKFSADDRASMRDVIEGGNVELAQKSQAAFALAKAFEDDGQFDEAFKHYAMANKLRPDIAFSCDDNKARVKDYIQAFDATLLADAPKGHEGEARPIFIVGLPRSGSTLIEQILSSHSLVEGTMELVTLPNLVRKIAIESGRRGGAYPFAFDRFSKDELLAFGQEYLDRTRVYRTDKPYFIDKMPPNFDRVGLIHMILPQAIVIDARRNPFDCGFSCFKQHFAGGHEFSYDLAHIGAYYNDYLAVMDHWDSVLPGKVHCVTYENMVQNTTQEIEALLTHCGLDVEEGCLNFHQNRRAVRTASSEQVRQPIYTQSFGHWKNVEKHLLPLRHALGDATLKRFEAWL